MKRIYESERDMKGHRLSPRIKQSFSPSSLFLLFGFIFILSIVMFIGYGSFKKEDDSLNNKKASIEPNPTLQGTKNAAISLGVFHRVEIKDGKTLWEVDGKEMKYYPDTELTHLNDLVLKLRRPDNSIVITNSDSAKLKIKDSVLDQAFLSGNIVVKFENQSKIHAQVSFYDRQTDILRADGIVSFEGPGYEIDGNGLIYNFKNESVEFLENVLSRFEVGVKIPAKDNKSE